MYSKALQVKKSHELVIAKYTYSLIETRLFTLVMGLIDDRDDDFQVYRIPIKDIINTFEIKSKKVYAEINQLANSMLKKIITLSVREGDDLKEIKTTLVSSFKYSVS